MGCSLCRTLTRQCIGVPTHKISSCGCTVTDQCVPTAVTSGPLPLLPGGMHRVAARTRQKQNVLKIETCILGMVLVMEFVYTVLVLYLYS